MMTRFLFTFAVQMQAVIVGWQVYELMRDPLYLGLVGLSEAVPAIGLALFAGYLVDRSRPVRIYRSVICISFISSLVVLASEIYAHKLVISNQVLSLYCASFLTGMARAFSQPSIFAIVPRIIARENLARSSAIMSMTMQVARIAGPAFGGVIFAWLGMQTASYFVSIFLLAAIGLAFSIRAQIEPPANPDKKPIRQELLTGLNFVLKHPILFPAMSLDMVSVFFGGVTALLPIFAKEVLMVGATGLGALRAAPAVGSALMAFALTRINIKNSAGRWLLISVAGFGLCILIFGLSKNFYLSIAVLGLSGMFDSVSMVVRTSAVQLVSPDHMRGRISAVNSIFIGSSNEIGEFESGVAAKFLGVVPAVYFGGVMCLLTVGIVAWMSPKLRQMDLEKI